MNSKTNYILDRTMVEAEVNKVNADKKVVRVTLSELPTTTRASAFEHIGDEYREDGILRVVLLDDGEWLDFTKGPTMLPEIFNTEMNPDLAVLNIMDKDMGLTVVSAPFFAKEVLVKDEVVEVVTTPETEVKTEVVESPVEEITTDDTKTEDSDTAEFSMTLDDVEVKKAPTFLEAVAKIQKEGVRP